jgi:1-aminocyclopropane-1-carboxylate deaminase
MQKLSEKQKNILDDFSPGPVQELPSRVDQPKLSMVRLDLLQSWTSGNKYYKLKFTLSSALLRGIPTVVSKGGMFSNHLAALADACNVLELKLVAVIRSYKPDESNPSIRHLREKGAEILYMKPEEYNVFDGLIAGQLCPGSMFIPEGGLSEEGIRGAADIINEIPTGQITHVILAGGSLGTACGIISKVPSSVKVIIVPSWKGCTENYVKDILHRFSIIPSCSWELWPEYHFGGFGKFNTQLVEFISGFYAETGIPLDPVYTGKLMFAIKDKISLGYFNPTDSILAIHTGGLQGIEGYKYRFPDQWGWYKV